MGITYHVCTLKRRRAFQVPSISAASQGYLLCENVHRTDGHRYMHQPCPFLPACQWSPWYCGAFPILTCWRLGFWQPSMSVAGVEIEFSEPRFNWCQGKASCCGWISFSQALIILELLLVWSYCRVSITVYSFILVRVGGVTRFCRMPKFQHTSVFRTQEKCASIERRVAGSDPSNRGRSPVVLEVRFRSRAFSIAEIQSEIVLGYLHYLDFCTV